MMRQQLALCLLFLLTACSGFPISQAGVSSSVVIATFAPRANTADLNIPAPVTPTPVALTDTVGQPIEGGIIAFTVNDINATMGAGRGDAPRGRHFYLVVNLTLQNTSITDTTPYDSANLSLLAPDGTTYAPIMVDMESLLDSGTLNAGDAVTANAVFEVPDSASELVLRYLYNVNDPPIQLDLGLLPAPMPSVE
jgi:hypothetical protein